MDYKRLKDPIYGYINIDNNYMQNIVDTSSFQRLRRIIQTSYSPLYSSAVHNRFVHSLGVYYLGTIAYYALRQEILLKTKTKLDLDEIGNTFILACLLHDVGHAPFSHTGESFYKRNNTYEELHKDLMQAVESESFNNDVPLSEMDAAAPHEIMSAIIGIDEYSELIPDKEMFARCITGYKYSNTSSDESIKNCLISLLNSKVIDVDKLDYLIRDAFISGFDTVNIDYNRLLTSLTIIENCGQYELAYYKSAISVIENVVYAHDAERKWIQTHPVVLYENYLLQHIFSRLICEIDSQGKNLFSRESLSKTGQDFGNGIRISLLCDDDIIFLMKNLFPNELSDEYFERKSRRHPIWKSEAEYKAFFLQVTAGGELLTNFENAMKATAIYFSKNTDSWVINESLIKKIENELAALEKSNLDFESKAAQKNNKTGMLKVMRCLKDYADKLNKKCDFVILMATQFNSGFSKPDFSATKIVFHTKSGDKVANFGEIVSSLNAKEKARDSFFYLFYNREEDNDDIDKAELCRRMFLAFI